MLRKYCIYIFFSILSISNVFAQANDSLLLHVSHASGLYNSTINFSIDYTNADRIYYTLDGSTPTLYNKRYRSPIQLEKSTVVKLLAVPENRDIDNKVYTYSYILGTDTKFPIISVSMNPDDLWDSLKGIYTKGKKAKWNETDKLWDNANYFQKWEKTGHLEYFDNGIKHLDQDIGIRIFGGMTRKNPDKSLLLIARKKYGNNRLDHNIFTEKEEKKIKSIILRTSGNDYSKTRFLDVLTTQLVKDLGLDYQAYTPAVMFMNGEYWGLYNIREKVNEHYLRFAYDIEKDSVNLLQGRTHVDHGSRKNYKELLRLINNSDMKSEATYSKIDSAIDIHNFCSYFSTQIYIGNADARGNIRYWQSPQLDNKFRWILYDTDLGFGNSFLPSHNFMKDMLTTSNTDWYNPKWTTFLFRKMTSNDKIKNHFLNQYAYAINTAFKTDSVLSKIDYFQDLYSSEIVHHFNVRKNKGSVKKWNQEINKLKVFATTRPKYALRNAIKAFDLDGLAKVHIKTTPAEAGTILINYNDLGTNKHTGTYFNNIPIPISGKADLLYNYTGMVVNSDTLSSMTAQPIEGSLRVELLFEKKKLSPHNQKVTLNEISFGSNNVFQPGDWIELYNDSNDTIELKNWVLADSENTIHFTDKKIAPKSYYLLAKDSVDMFIKYEKACDQSLSFGLNKYGERIVLLDNNNELVDTFSYANTIALSDSLEIIGEPFFTFSRKNHTKNIWSVDTGLGTPGGDNTPLQYEKKKKGIYYFVAGIAGLLLLVLLYTLFFNRRPKNILD